MSDEVLDTVAEPQEPEAAISRLAGRKYYAAVLGEEQREFNFRSPTLYQLGEFEKRFGGLENALEDLTAESIGTVVWILGLREEGFREEFPSPEDWNKFVDLADVPELTKVCEAIFFGGPKTQEDTPTEGPFPDGANEQGGGADGGPPGEGVPLDPA